ncbi:endonuclease/exonuclease/phosphatase family protein [Micromonospora sp. WMMD882]|uniref:endonuclease/exonuclease/phosphatase family protein n=1 Tax=Micromonospora sp. WMMD882 TaxID=3015151 RepID=UPI00248AB054|nr:endonuclease/exonuclease/phosphatase family protein [Micromonospora sp. WMMD882]WBB81696.1 endonuclease/exonuclease/phosphatase family protein [Micromonospora sp. WMMD882]
MLRVITWNIRTGGRDRGGPDRLDRVVRVVTEQRPDLLAVQELRGFDRDGTADRFAEAVGMRAYLVRSRFGQPVAVLVRPPWRARAAGPVRRPFHHAAQRVTVDTAAGPLTVVSAHLDPYRGWRRRVEAGWLAAAVRRAPGELALLAGDLNTLEPGVDHTARIARLPAAYRSRHLRRDGRTPETRAVARLRRAGLVDLFDRAGDGPPETAPTACGGGVEFSGMRLDYLLGTPALAALARGCRVARGGETEHASDHYPVVVDLDLDPA